MPIDCVFILGYGERYFDGPKHRLQVKGTPVCQRLKDLSLYGAPTAVYGLVTDLIGGWLGFRLFLKVFILALDKLKLRVTIKYAKQWPHTSYCQH